MRIFKGVNSVIPYKNDVPVPRRHISRERKIYTCSNCKYQSNRRFNMERHQERIHWNLNLHVCCGIQFYNKGDYYVHCELSHPETRLYAIISKSKYKIINDSMVMDHGILGEQISNSCNWQLEQQFSEKIRIEHKESTRQLKSQLSLKYMFTCDNIDIEDIPLIYFLTDQRLRSYVKRLPYSRLKHKVNDESKKPKRSLKIAISAKQIVREELSEVNDKMRFRSYLKKLPSSQLINKSDDKSSEQKQSVEIAISSKQSVEKELNENVVSNCQMKVSNSTVSSISLKLPTKKLLLHRFRTDVVQECELPLREQNNNCMKQVNFAEENTPSVLQSRPKNCKRFNRVNKENVSKLPFSLEEQLKVHLDRDMMVPVVTQSHRDFLDAIDFEKYKIF